VAEEPHVRVEVVPAPRRRKVTVLIRDRVGVTYLDLQRFDLPLGDGQELRGLAPLRVARGICQDVAHEPRVGLRAQQLQARHRAVAIVPCRPRFPLPLGFSPTGLEPCLQFPGRQVQAWRRVGVLPLKEHPVQTVVLTPRLAFSPQAPLTGDPVPRPGPPARPETHPPNWYRREAAST